MNIPPMCHICWTPTEDGKCPNLTCGPRLHSKLEISREHFADGGMSTTSTYVCRHFQTKEGQLVILTGDSWWHQIATHVLSSAWDILGEVATFDLSDPIWIIHWARADGGHVCVRVPKPSPSPDVSMLSDRGSDAQGDRFDEGILCAMLKLNSLADLDSVQHLGSDVPRHPASNRVDRLCLKMDLRNAETKVRILRERLGELPACNDLEFMREPKDLEGVWADLRTIKDRFLQLDLSHLELVSDHRKALLELDEKGRRIAQLEDRLHDNAGGD